MKRLLSLIIIVFASVLMAFGESFTYDGIKYNIISSNTVEVIKSNYSGDISIPESVVYKEKTYIVTSIGNETFLECSGLTSITIPNSVTSIGTRAFYACNGLTSITIPNSVTSIGTHAFYNCNGLTSITIPNSVTSIGTHAFYNCNGLTSITIPNSVTSIETCTFYNCSGLTSVTIGNSVTSIGTYAFYNCNGLTSIIIPDKVTSIEQKAFMNCSHLDSVTFGESLNSIGDNAFYYCDSLHSVIIKNNNISSLRLGSNAFTSQLSSMTFLCNVVDKWPKQMTTKKIILGEQVKVVKDGAFDNFSDFDLITMSPTPPLLEAKISCKRLETPFGAANNYAKSDKWKDIDVIFSVKDYIDYYPIPYLFYGNRIVTINGKEGDYEAKEGEQIEISLKSVDDYFVVTKDNDDITNILKQDGKYLFNASKYQKDNIINSFAYQPLTINLQNGGELLNAIDFNKIDEIQGLKISGKINGTDILVIRKMTNLRYLDLKEAEIINGGMSYYEDYITSQNEIGCYFFSEKMNLTNVILPKTATTIGKMAFDGCTSLVHVEIPDKLSIVEEKAFGNCVKLKSIVIPQSIDFIHDEAFAGCNNLERVEIYCKTIKCWFKGIKTLRDVFIGDNVKTIKKEAFSNCKIQTVNIAHLNSWLDIDFEYDIIRIHNEQRGRGGKLVYSYSHEYYDCSSNPISYADNLTIEGKSVSGLEITCEKTQIKPCTFWGCKSLTSISIANSIASIGECAFAHCENLKSVYFGDNISVFKNDVFTGCNNLQAVHISNIATWCGVSFSTYRSSYTYYDGDRRLRASSSETISYDSNPLVKAPHLYINNEEIKNLVIPEGVETINDYTFFNLSSITSITLPQTLLTIKNYAFTKTDNIESITFNCSTIKSWFRGRTNLKTIILGNNVKIIDEYAFSSTGITTITIPNSVVSIKSYAFNGCGELNSILLGDNLKSIEEGTFYNCKNLKSILFPNSVTSIGSLAFKGCKSLTSLTLGRNIAELKSDAFEDCENISTLTLSCRNVKSWFKGVSSIKEIIINDCVESLEHNAFSNCSGLYSVTIGNGLSSIGKNTFYKCENLTSVSLGNGLISIGENAFNGCKKLCSVTFVSSLKSIGDYAFKDCRSLESIVLCNNINSIGEGSFMNCEMLTSMVMSDSLKFISPSLLSGCINLTSVIIGKQVTSIETKAFENCKRLVSISVPDSVKAIADNCFYGCDTLSVLVLGSNVKSIGVNVFHKCQNIAKIFVYNTIPPEIKANTFDEETFKKASLFVPQGCKTIYWLHPYWENFTNMVEIDASNIKHTLTYKVDGEVYKTYKLKAGDKITPEAEPTKEGYTFSGWSEIPSTMPSHDVTVSGTFTKNDPNQYTLTYLVDGEVYKTYKLKVGDKITPEAEPTKEGYTFSGWSDIPSTMPNHDVTVSGTFTKNGGGVDDVPNKSIQTLIFDGNSQPPIVGGKVTDIGLKEKGIIVSDKNENLTYDANKKEEVFWTFNIKDFKVIDCTEIGKEQFWCPILNLKSDKDYYVKAYAIQLDGSIIYGQTEKIHSLAFNRYSGATDYANVYYYNNYTLFDLITDEIIPKEDGYYGSTNENPTKVAFKPSYYCYKFKTEWNYKLWYYNGPHCVQSKRIHTPLITIQGNKLFMEKNPLDTNRDITIYYSVNGNYFRPENFNNTYSSPIEISEPCTVCCYGISSDGYISYTNMYVVSDINSSVGITVQTKENSKDDKYYNLQGQRVLYPRNGIYIKNGKKVFIK